MYIHSDQIFEIKLIIFIITFYIPKKKIFSIYIYIQSKYSSTFTQEDLYSNYQQASERISTMLEEISVFAKMPFLCKLPLVRGKSHG